MEEKKRKRRPNRERIIICLDCGAEVKTRYSRTVRCPECSAKHMKQSQKEWARKQNEARKVDKATIMGWHKNDFTDSPENIQMCLNCKRPKCTNCIQNNKERRDYARKRLLKERCKESA